MQLQDQKLFRQQAYVDGKWIDALNRGTIPVTNPATGETLGTVPRMGAEETRQAIEAADKALPAWRAKTAKERAQILRKWFDLMMANQDDLAQPDDRRARQAARRIEEARSPMPRRSSNGSAKRASGSTATPSRRTASTSASSS